ncbi:hypothetical protein [Fusobacterium ulcerans]|uniref:hypothetical protein n=1 Tax=Fusobacterium ulcerans TaxID=861 RepID=UPI002E7636A6|nr:hypothetical protein [Fusobacterium ulcerans]MEE0140006.1 hypothetical protein [Fusobacterium ulcerans]
MIKIGDRVKFRIGLFKGKGGKIEAIYENAKGKGYVVEGFDQVWTEEALDVIPEKKDGLYVTVGCDPELIKGVRDTISEAVCELQEYATNEHSYYTKDGKEMLSTWKQKGKHIYDVHVFEKVTECNWKQLS